MHSDYLAHDREKRKRKENHDKFMEPAGEPTAGTHIYSFLDLQETKHYN